MTESVAVSHHDLAAAIDDVIVAVRQAADADGWDFTAESPAVEDWSTRELPGEWGPEPLQDAYRTGLVLWWYISDAALALIDAIRNDRPFAYVSLARAVAEASARSWYLLQPGIAPLERVRRLMNDRLFATFERHTMWRQEDQMAALLTRDAGTAAAIGRAARASRLSFEPEKRGQGKFSAARVGQPRPKSMPLIALAIRDDQAAAVFYRSSSALLHAALNSVDGRLHMTADGRITVRGLDADRVVADITAAVVAMLVAVATIVQQTGWNSEHVDEAMNAAHVTWSRVE